VLQLAHPLAGDAKLGGPLGDVLGYVAGVLSNPADHRRGERVLEGEPQEVQTRCDVHHAPILQGVAVLAEDGEGVFIAGCSLVGRRLFAGRYLSGSAATRRVVL
jgi:hypothetical protein